MDALLQQIATSSVTFVGKAAYSYAATLALRRINEFAQAPKDPQDSAKHSATLSLRRRLERKLGILIPIIDSIYLEIAMGSLSAHSNALLDLTNELQSQLDHLADHSNPSTSAQSNGNEIEFRQVLELVDDLIPLLSLHLSATSSSSPRSGSNQQQNQPRESQAISYSRLLKASAALVTGDAIVSFQSTDDVKPNTGAMRIGNVIPVRLYTLFEGSARKTGKAGTWKEELRLATCSIYRIGKERKYQLRLYQDLDDGMYHESTEDPAVKMIEIGQISKMYYSLSGSLLELSEDSSGMPVLVLKLVQPPATVEEGTPGGGGKVEWIALELVWSPNHTTSASSSSSDASEDEQEGVTRDLNNMSLKGGDAEKTEKGDDLAQLCLLEYLIRLCAMESQYDTSHTKVPDSLFHTYFQNGISSSSSNGPVNSSSATVQKGATESPLATRKKGGLIDRFLGGSQGFLAFLNEYLAQYSTYE